MWPSIQMAKKMGKRLGRGKTLQSKVSNEQKKQGQ